MHLPVINTSYNTKVNTKTAVSEAFRSKRLWLRFSERNNPYVIHELSFRYRVDFQFVSLCKFKS